MFRHDVLRYVYVALRIDCGWDVEIEGEGEKERTSLRLNVIIYEPRKKSKLRLTDTGVSGGSW